MYMRLTKKQKWHILDGPVGVYVKSKCGKDFNYSMVLKAEELSDSDGLLCQQCTKGSGEQGS